LAGPDRSPAVVCGSLPRPRVGSQALAQLALSSRLVLAIVRHPVSSETRLAPRSPRLAPARACAALHPTPSGEKVVGRLARGLRPCPCPAGCSFGSNRSGHRQRPRPRCCCPFRQTFFGRRAGPRGGPGTSFRCCCPFRQAFLGRRAGPRGAPGRRSTQATSGFFGNRDWCKWTWRRCSSSGFVSQAFAPCPPYEPRLGTCFGRALTACARWPDNGPVAVLPLLGEVERLPGRRPGHPSWPGRSASSWSGPRLTPVAVPLTQAAWLPLFFGAVAVGSHCNVRPSKSLCALDDLPSAPVSTARSLVSLRRSHSEQAHPGVMEVHRPPVGAGMIRLVKLWPALRPDSRSLR
jgi:hypothetical protein